MRKRTLFVILFVVLALGVVVFVSVLFARARFQYRDGNAIVGYRNSKSTVNMDVAPLYEQDDVAFDEVESSFEGSKIQKNGSISLLVEKIDASLEMLKGVNAKYSAQVMDIDDYGKGNDRVVNVTVRVPVADFEDYYEDVKEMGVEVEYARISTLDVTEEYIDITSRLKNLRSVESQLVGILGNAKSVTDILAVQKELSNVRGEIERYEAQKRYLDSKTDYSYITVAFSIDKVGLNISDEAWRPLGELKVALNALVSVLKGLLNLGIWVLVFSPLLLLPVGVVYFLVKRKRKK
ncbi:MAG: DUF4349 domain-containing protein [Candidatus Dojkabacteria bacterium]|jgi:hypothetical protein